MYERLLGALDNRSMKSTTKMIVSVASTNAISVHDSEPNGNTAASTRFAIERTETARMKNSYVVLLRSPRSPVVDAALTRSTFAPGAPVPSRGHQATDRSER